jgi:hypothetical protein
MIVGRIVGDVGNYAVRITYMYHMIRILKLYAPNVITEIIFLDIKYK